MDGIHFSSSTPHESFAGTAPASAHTFSRLATFITQVEQHPVSHSQLVCRECDERFPFAADLLRHQEQTHTLPKPHGCGSCGQKFSLKSSLQLHSCDAAQDGERKRPGQRADSSPYECVPCGRGFKQKQALLQHQQARCREPSPHDTDGSRGFPNDSSPVSDEESTLTDSSDTPGSKNHSGSFRRCQFCSETFRTDTGLQYHTKRYHADDVAPRPAQNKGAKGRRASTDSGKRLRSRKKHLKCRSCDMVFGTTSTLQTHRREKHSRDRNVMAEPKLLLVRSRRSGSYPCPVCGKVFVHHLSLKAHCRHQHTATISSGGPTPEDACFAKVFKLSEIRVCLSDITRVRNGEGARTEDKPAEDDPRSAEEEPREEEEEEEEEEEDREFPCPSCPEVFALQRQLKEHVELHQSSVRSGRCSVCTHHMDSRRWPASKRQRLYHCVPCRQGFSALASFLQHCQEHLKVRVEQDGMAQPGGRQPDGPPS